MLPELDLIAGPFQLMKKNVKTLRPFLQYLVDIPADPATDRFISRILGSLFPFGIRRRLDDRKTVLKANEIADLLKGNA